MDGSSKSASLCGGQSSTASTARFEELVESNVFFWFLKSHWPRRYQSFIFVSPRVQEQMPEPAAPAPPTPAPAQTPSSPTPAKPAPAAGRESHVTKSSSCRDSADMCRCWVQRLHTNLQNQPSDEMDSTLFVVCFERPIRTGYGGDFTADDLRLAFGPGQSSTLRRPKELKL